jgi:hypothetical protein
MSTQHAVKRYQRNSWCIDIMEKPWFVDAATYILVLVWMAWMFATIQQQGPDTAVIASGVVVLLVPLLLVYGQRLAYVRFGRFELGTRDMRDPESEEPSDWQRENR